MSRRPGKLVKHEDGRRGIVYNDAQLPQLLKEDKIVVQFIGVRAKPDGKPRAVLRSKLSVIGFID